MITSVIQLQKKKKNTKPQWNGRWKASQIPSFNYNNVKGKIIPHTASITCQSNETIR